MATCMKKEYDDENRRFRQEWEEKFSFIERSERPLCVICNTVLNDFKVGSPKRHYDTNHEHFHYDISA